MFEEQTPHPHPGKCYIILVGTTVLSGGPKWELQANVLWGKQKFDNNLRGAGGGAGAGAGVLPIQL